MPARQLAAMLHAQQRDQHPGQLVVLPVGAPGPRPTSPGRWQWGAASRSSRPGRAGRSGAAPGCRPATPARPPWSCSWRGRSCQHSGIRWRAAVALAQGLLHQHDVQPAVELPAAGLTTPTGSKPSALCTPMEPRWPNRRSRPSPCGCHRARAPPAVRPARRGPAPACRFGCQVDRVLDRKPVGRAGLEPVAVGKTQHLSGRLRSPARAGPWPARRRGAFMSAMAGRGGLESAGAVQHVVAVNAGDGVEIVVAAGADQGHGIGLRGPEWGGTWRGEMDPWQSGSPGYNRRLCSVSLAGWSVVCLKRAMRETGLRMTPRR
jgi:hypothetical protein